MIVADDSTNRLHAHGGHELRHRSLFVDGNDPTASLLRIISSAEVTVLMSHLAAKMAAAVMERAATKFSKTQLVTRTSITSSLDATHNGCQLVAALKLCTFDPRIYEDLRSMYYLLLLLQHSTLFYPCTLR
eukprot:TRINITY_DN2206_c1_g1_i1.p1 TRINITY_DN2206_c1_g1~~TRINITY_DN2206_c1_g1_i1.p1  ORF type:complete len:131 (+),score=14.97 TRINITY_DN2206_c1_g1_i1:1040-1432(+)